jgi:DNA-binding HxlR family transcriptional regulator
MLGAENHGAAMPRAGCRALLLLADPVRVSILRLLARRRSIASTDLLERVGHVSRSSFFDRLRDLEGLSLIVRERRASVPPVADCRISGSGQRLLLVADLLDAWLACAPEGPLGLGDASATLAVKALALGWGSTLLRWLAERPRSLTELERIVDGLGYRKLERVAHNLVEAGLAERIATKGRLNPYTVTPWARESARPFVAAVRWEQREIPEHCSPATAIEAMGGLMLALPLIDRRAEAMEGLISASDASGDDHHRAEELIARLHETLLGRSDHLPGRLFEQTPPYGYDILDPENLDF